MINFETTTAAPVVTNVPTLTSSLRLVELSISVWSGRKQDKNATASAALANNTRKDLLNTTKKLLGDCEELEAIRKFAANARNFMYGCTSAWGDLGQRALPFVRFPQFHKEITGLQAEFDQLRDIFLSVYDYRKSIVQAELGALWNPDEYPDANTLRDKFRFSIAYPPVPEVNIFSAVQDEAERYLRDEYAKVYTERIEATMREIWYRVYESLKKMSERLDYQGKEDKKKFHDTLVSNVRDLAALLPDFNVTNDARMTSLHAALDQTLSGVTPDALREDDMLRAQTKARVDAVLKNMSW